MTIKFDTDDLDKFQQFKRHISHGYLVNRSGYKKKTTTYFHRLVMNAKDGGVVDHINRDKLDNRKSNLRVCTQAENVINKRLQKNNTTGYRGVHLYKRVNRYQAYIKKDGKRRHIGMFPTAEEAAKEYNKHAIKLFGEFAVLNEVKQ